MLGSGDVKARHIAAEGGDPDAQMSLGWDYLTGEGLDRNPARAAEWLGAAATSGRPEAVYRYAVCLIMSRDRRGIELLEKLSADGYAPAIYELGNCLFTGNLVDSDAERGAAKWAEAASQGHLLARMKALKYQLRNPDVPGGMVIRFVLTKTLLEAAWVVVTKGNDPRVLGSRR